KLERHLETLLGGTAGRIRHDSAAARRAAHASTNPQTEPRAPRNVVDGRCELIFDDVSNLRFGDGLARADHGRLARVAQHALEHAQAAAAVAIFEARRGHRLHAALLDQLHRIDLLVAARERRDVAPAFGPITEPASDQIRHFFGENPVAGELAADHRVQAVRTVRRVIYDLVLTAEVVLVAAPSVERGTYAAPGSDGTGVPHTRKNALNSLKQISDLVAGREHVVQIAVVIVVRRAEHARILPRQKKDLPAVHGGRQDRVVGQTPVEKDVNALAGPHARGARI